MSERKIVNRCECSAEDRKPQMRTDQYKTEICSTCYEVISYEMPTKQKATRANGVKKVDKKERKANVDTILLPSQEVRLPNKEYSFNINTIYNEDCMETMKRMKTGEVDYVFTSPPYNVSQEKFAKYEDFSDDKSQQEYVDWSIKVISELLRVTKQHVFYNIQELAHNKIAIQCLLYHFRYNLKEKFIWRKSGGAAQHNHKVVSCRWEYIWCLSNQAPLYKNFTDVETLKDWHNVIEIKTTKNIHAKDHKAVFPLNLPRKFIERFGKEGDLWYDPFTGTGTTQRAAVLSGRKYVGSEMSSKVHKIAIKEIKNTIESPTLAFFDEMEAKEIPKPKVRAVDTGGKHKQIEMEIG